jgi:hypothetical protein
MHSFLFSCFVSSSSLVREWTSFLRLLTVVWISCLSSFLMLPFLSVGIDYRIQSVLKLQAYVVSHLDCLVWVWVCGYVCRYVGVCGWVWGCVCGGVWVGGWGCGFLWGGWCGGGWLGGLVVGVWGFVCVWVGVGMCVGMWVCVGVRMGMCVGMCGWVCVGGCVWVCVWVCEISGTEHSTKTNIIPSGCTETIRGSPLIILTPQIRLHLNYSFKGPAAITRNCKQTDAHKLYFTTMQLSQYRFLVACHVYVTGTARTRRGY